MKLKVNQSEKKKGMKMASEFTKKKVYVRVRRFLGKTRKR
jgi:hypothetical protein